MIVFDTDPNLEPFDVDINGTTMYSYNGTPFTGVIKSYIPGSTSVIESELNYLNGYKWGLQTLYYDNGQMCLQYTIGIGGVDGMMQKWDEQGNVIYSKMWIQDVQQ